MKFVHRLLLAAVVAAGSALTAIPSTSATGTDSTARPPAPKPSGDEPLFESVDIANSGIGAHTYRIPALEKLPDGTLIAAYDRRNDDASDLPGDIDVLVERSYDNGRTWTDPVVVSGADTEVGSGDPSIIVDDQTGRIHLFYASGNGFRQSGTGNDNDNPNLIHLDHAYSDDGGRTWTERRLTETLKDPGWKGIFASSGTGIQLKTGPHAGRLIQQYTFQKVDGSIWAVSAYSDDHGRTWQMGRPVGPLMDENKTVELADGRIMLNSRTSSGPYRLVAYSRDGGVTYSEPKPDRELVDPTNNAAIIRYDEDANPSRPQAHRLLFSNTADPHARRNLTIKMSCNDGKTWPIARTVEPGASAYSTMVELGDGTFGLLYERGNYEHITFARFNAAWLGADCPASPSHPELGTKITDAGDLTAGQQGTVEVSVTNHGHRTSVPGSLTLDVPRSWSVQQPQQDVPPLEAGASTTLSFTVTPSESTRAGEYELAVQIKAGATRKTATPTVLVLGADPVLAAQPDRGYDGVDDYTDLTGRLDSVRQLEQGVLAVDLRTSDIQVAGALLSSSDTDEPSTNVTLALNSGVPYYESRQDGSYAARVSATESVADGGEHTVALVSDAGGTRIYVNGTRVASSSDQAFFGHVGGLDGLWAGRNVDNAGPQWHFGGHIDRIRIYGTN
ncbi:exo-alpha-sialidase [Haloactinomyces albus]|uniref:exo-alpha-sialidase n=1 Tax=Haloactinomyces albus TaxID=1352928 RepID=A0AAE3ZH78_9ACTN|nr:exo-alpha-sialidase [Haloactinomyces albus]MDR7303544.1 sialidase-1 [Haloactinomyces albus]